MLSFLLLPLLSPLFAVTPTPGPLSLSLLPLLAAITSLSDHFYYLCKSDRGGDSGAGVTEGWGRQWGESNSGGGSGGDREGVSEGEGDSKRDSSTLVRDSY